MVKAYKQLVIDFVISELFFVLFPSCFHQETQHVKMIKKSMKKNLFAAVALREMFSLTKHIQNSS